MDTQLQLLLRPRGEAMIHWWQCFWGHSWTKWHISVATTKCLQPHPVTGAMGVDKKVMVQVRDCEVCGLIQTRYWK